MQNPDNKNPEEVTTETVDRRLFNTDGEVREDVAAERAETEEEEVELTLDVIEERRVALEAKTMHAMEQVDNTFTQVGQELHQLTQQMRTAISDMHVRLGVLEEISTNPDLQADRQAFVDGKLTMERYKEIAHTIVLPDMKVKAEAMQKKMEKRFARIQAGIQSGLTPEEAVAKVSEEDQKANEGSDIEVVSG